MKTFVNPNSPTPPTYMRIIRKLLGVNSPSLVSTYLAWSLSILSILYAISSYDTLIPTKSSQLYAQDSTCSFDFDKGRTTGDGSKKKPYKVAWDQSKCNAITFLYREKKKTTIPFYFEVSPFKRKATYSMKIRRTAGKKGMKFSTYKGKLHGLSSGKGNVQISVGNSFTSTIVPNAQKKFAYGIITTQGSAFSFTFEMTKSP